MHRSLQRAAIATLLALGTALPVLAQSTEVNVYSYREPGLIQPLLDTFSAETGIKANVLFAGDGLIERVEAEGELSPVDVVLTVDIGNLVAAKDKGIAQPIGAAALDRQIDGDRLNHIKLHGKAFAPAIAVRRERGRLCTERLDQFSVWLESKVTRQFGGQLHLVGSTQPECDPALHEGRVQSGNLA